MPQVVTLTFVDSDDNYGDDFLDPEWALLGIAKAPCPFADYTHLKRNKDA